MGNNGGRPRTVPKVEIGQIYGKLTVVSFAFKKHYREYWACHCECGAQAIVASTGLQRGTKSCGCLARREPGEAAANWLYVRYKKEAKDRGLVFELTSPEFKDLTKGNCRYCGSEPARKTAMKGSYGDYVYNGVDRVNNDLGYVSNNIVPCCTTCNRMKRDLGEQEFFDQIQKMAAHIKTFKIC